MPVFSHRRYSSYDLEEPDIEIARVWAHDEEEARDALIGHLNGFKATEPPERFVPWAYVMRLDLSSVQMSPSEYAEWLYKNPRMLNWVLIPD